VREKKTSSVTQRDKTREREREIER
jgi:hypothetical protein